MKTSCLTFAISPPELHLVIRGTSFVSLWWVPWDFFFNASTEPGTVFRPSLPHSHDFVFFFLFLFAILSVSFVFAALNVSATFD